MSTPLPPRTEEVLFYTNEDLRQIEVLSAALNSGITRLTAVKKRHEKRIEIAEEAPRAIGEDAPSDDDADDPAVASAKSELREAAEAHDAFVTEASGRATKIVVKALTRKQWRSLVQAHPMRMVSGAETKTDDDGNEVEVPTEHVHPEDEVWGFNVETMPDDLVPAAVADGQFDTPADRDAFLDSLSDPDYSRVYSVAVSLSTQGARAPKAGASSLIDQIFAATSRSLGPSA